MTPILYKSDEIDFTNNGLGQMNELYSVDIQEQRNGMLTLTGSYPVTGQHYADITEGRIILAKPSPLGDNHAFRIVNTQLDISGHSLQIEADSITYDLTHNLVKSVTMKGNGSTAMSQLQKAIVNASIFTLYSDITTSSTSVLNYVNPMEAIAGTQGSFLQYWGGEMKRENRRVAMLNRRGRDNVATFRLGKNINGLRYTVDTSNLVTQIIPTINLTQGDTTRYLEGATVSSKRVATYPIKYTQAVDVTDKITINDGDSDATIIGRINAFAGNWFTQSENTGKDLPDVMIEVDVLSLQDSADYNDKFAKLETIGLTDTVTVYVPEYGVNVTAIVNELHYDPIGERVTSMVVGTAKVSFAEANQNALSDLQGKVTHVQEQTTQAVISANGKNSNYSGRSEPAHPQEGDTWFWDDGTDSGIRLFTNGKWVDSVDTQTQKRIDNAVDNAIDTSKSYTDELNDKQTTLTNSLVSDVQKKADSLSANQQTIASQASSYTDSALAQANANAQQIGQTTAQNAQKALDNAKSDLSKSIASEVSARSQAVSSINSQAQSYANKAKSDAITSATTADGVIRKDFKDTTDGLTSTITQNKKMADDGISTAQTTAQQAVDGLKTKVSQTDYNAKTGQLQTDLTATTQTANQAKTDIVSIKQKDGEQDAKMNTIISDANGTKQTVSDLKTEQGKQSGSISELQQRADGFDATVTKVGELDSATAKAQLTADNATLALNNYKTDADGRISKAQADIVVNASAINQKVSQTDYDKKTGDLTTSVNKAQQTADSATQTIGNYQTSNDKRVKAAETNIEANADAIKSTVSKTEFNEATGKLSGSISSLEQRADGFDATVTKVNNLSVGGRNYVLNSDVSTSSNITNFKTSIPISGFSGKKIVISVQVDYDNITGLVNSSPFHRVMFEPTIIDKKTGKTIYASANILPKVGDSFHGRIYSFFDFSNTELISATSDANTLGQGIYVQGLASNTPIVVSKPMIEIGTQPTDWTSAPEDTKTQMAQIKLTADGVYQTVNDPKTGLNTRVSTAEGNFEQIKSNVDGLTNTVTNTADGLTQEIKDRASGDSNTLQAGKDFTTSQIKSYDTGMQTQLSQTADGIMAQVSATNMVSDSSFVNALVNWTLTGDVNWAMDSSSSYKGVRIATFNNGTLDNTRKTSTLTSAPIYKTNFGGTQLFASVDIFAKSFGTSAYMKAEVIQKNSAGTTVKSTSLGGSFDTAMSDWNNYSATIDLENSASSIYMTFTMYGNGVVNLARPYIGTSKLRDGGYVAGAVNDNSSTLKLFNNFFAFGIQANTGALISGINGDSSGLNIVGKKITINGDTTFLGKSFMDGALIKNASIGSAQIADVSITNAKIASLDVNKISGNVSNFIQSNWNGKYGSTTINSTGMTVNSGGVITDFMNSGMKLSMAGESVGGIGVQGMTGKPATYQGLTFWLDGNAEYMAWAARNSGDTSMNPVIQMSWYRSNSAPAGAYAGFNFDDDVIFNQGINVPGIAKEKLGFTTKTFNGFNYPYFGDSRLQAGLAYGSGYTYLISGTTYYNLTRVIKALDNLGAVKIPSVINSDGTVKKWFNVTL